jgi:Bacterial Ig domain
MYLMSAYCGGFCRSKAAYMHKSVKLVMAVILGLLASTSFGDSPKITSISITNRNVLLQMQGPPGSTYAVRTSTNLATSPLTWGTIGNVNFPSGGVATASFQDPAGSSLGKCFYALVQSTKPITVSLSSPTNGGFYLFGAPLWMTAQISDPQSLMTNIQLVVSGQAISSSSWMSSTYIYPTNPGLQQAWAVITDKYGATVQSAPISYTVDTNHPPAITNLAVNPDGYGAFLFSASVTDYEGAANHVDYYVSGTNVGSGLSYNNYQMTWRGGVGTYTLTGKAFDNFEAWALSAPLTFIVSNATAPSIVLTNPLPGSVLAQSNIIIGAMVVSEINVRKVDFYVNGSNFLGSAVGTPYVCSWKPNTAGIYTLRATVTDYVGQQSTSDPVSVQVTTNVPPSVFFVTPNQTLPFGTDLFVTMVATDPENRMNSILVYDGGTTVFQTGGYSVTNYLYWSRPEVGQHQLTACAIDEQGLITWSNPLLVTVSPNVPPSITITNPVPGMVVTNASHLSIIPRIVDNNYSMSYVTYFCNGIYIGTANNQPYAFEWYPYPALNPGTNWISATAYDKYGGISQAPAISFIVPYP